MKIYSDISGFSLDKFKVITNFRSLSHYRKVFFRTGNRVMGVVLQEVKDEISRQGRTGRIYNRKIGFKKYNWQASSSDGSEPIANVTGLTRRLAYKKNSFALRQLILGSKAPYSGYPEGNSNYMYQKLAPRNTFKRVLFRNKYTILNAIAQDLIKPIYDK